MYFVYTVELDVRKPWLQMPGENLFDSLTKQVNSFLYTDT